jgi:hypothetical protein
MPETATSETAGSAHRFVKSFARVRLERELGAGLVAHYVATSTRGPTPRFGSSKGQWS